MRGVRGATVIPEDDQAAAAAVRALLHALVQANGIRVEDLAAALFSLPPEISQVRAAAAAREMGWDTVPLFEVTQPVRADDLPRCLRVLLLWNTHRGAGEVRHIYLGETARLRLDLAQAACLPPGWLPGEKEELRP